MSVLRRENKAEIGEMIQRLVKLFTPTSVFSVGGYANEVVEFIFSKNHIFQDKYNFGSLSAASKSNKLPQTLLDSARVNLRDLHRNDQAWIRDTVKYYAIKYRTSAPIGSKKRKRIRAVDENTPLTQRERIVDVNDREWVNWGSHECVFSAILIALGMRFCCIGKEKQDKAKITVAEQAIHTALAERLGLPRRTVADESLVYLLEERFGWPRCPVETVGDLSKCENGHSYVVSCCENAQTDFWHVIYAQRIGGWKIVDRQYERKFGQKRASFPGDPAKEANAWQIDPQTALCGELRMALGIQALKGTHMVYLTDI
jgi:hypothetical protein